MLIISIYLLLRRLFFDFISVIGGYNIYLTISTIGECENKDSLWKTLQSEVITLTIQVNYRIQPSSFLIFIAERHGYKNMITHPCEKIWF